MRDWIISIRKNKGMTQEQVANQSFIDRAYYSQIERGTRNPSVVTAMNIANTLGFNPVEFFDGSISEPFRETLNNSPVILTHCGLDLKYTWVYNSTNKCMKDKILGKCLMELDDCEGSSKLIELKKQVIITAKPVMKTIRFQIDDENIDFTVYVKPLIDKSGKTIGVATISMEINT